MLGTLVLAGIGSMLMSNPRRRKKARRSKSRRRNPAGETAWFKGNKARYTGKVETIHGGVFYEVKMLEGSDKGKLRWIKTAPAKRNPKPKLNKKAYVLQAYYPGSGWDDVLEEDTKEDIRRQIKTYRDNDPNTPYRWVSRRYKEISTNPRRHRGARAKSRGHVFRATVGRETWEARTKGALRRAAKQDSRRLGKITRHRRAR